MIQGQRVEWADVTMTDEEEVVRFKGAFSQLAWFTLGFHGVVGVVHIRKIHVPHCLAHCFFPADTSEFLMIEQHDADVEDEGYKYEGSRCACGFILVAKDPEFVNVQGA